MLKKCFLLLLLPFLATSLSGQIQLYNWQAFTSMTDVRSMMSHGQTLAVGTVGGAYIYDLASGEFRLFRNVGELLTIDISCVAINPENGDTYFAGNNGNIDILTESGEWQHITDIKTSNIANPSIKDIKFHDGRVYIAGGFGLAVFDPVKKVFIEDVKRLGDFGIGTEVRKILFHKDEIWVATVSGLAKTTADNSISDRFDWTNFTIQEGLADFDMRDIRTQGDSLFALSQTRIYKLDSSSFVTVFSVTPPEKMTAFGRYKDRWIYATRGETSQVKDTAGNTLDIDFPNPSSQINMLYFSPDDPDALYLGTNLSGVIRYEESSISQINPNAPSVNAFEDIHIGDDGVLWCVTGHVFRNGIMRYHNGDWKNYSRSTHPEIITDSYHKIASATDGRMVFATHGAGLIYFDDSGSSLALEQFTEQNSPMVGVYGEGYSVVGEMRYDPNETLWLVNWGESSSGPILLARNAEGTFYPFFNRLNVSQRSFLNLAIDQSGTKWIGSCSSDPLNPGSVTTHGVYYLNERGASSLGNTADDAYGLISASNSKLSSNTVNSIVTDDLGMVLLGTSKGLDIIVNPYSVLGSNPSLIIRSAKPVEGKYIRDIELDALDNKWVATNSGVYVLNPDCTELLATISSENSPLADNDVTALEYDPRTGKVYFGTARGLFSVETSSIQPLESFDLNIYPQPFDPEKNDGLVIEGLAEEADIKITTVNGEIVKNLPSRSRRAIWDGKTENGQDAANGVYLLIATSLANESKQVAKFAIVRK